MEIRYKNFVIQDDRSWYILSTMGVTEKGTEVWKEYVKDQIYPSTLEWCLLKIIEKIKGRRMKLLL